MIEYDTHKFGAAADVGSRKHEPATVAALDTLEQRAARKDRVAVACRDEAFGVDIALEEPAFHERANRRFNQRRRAAQIGVPVFETASEVRRGHIVDETQSARSRVRTATHSRVRSLTTPRKTTADADAMPTPMRPQRRERRSSTLSATDAPGTP